MVDKPGNVITIDNFNSKISRIDLEGNSLFAIVDMGRYGMETHSRITLC
jgi:hypothetical protein